MKKKNHLLVTLLALSYVFLFMETVDAQIRMTHTSDSTSDSHSHYVNILISTNRVSVCPNPTNSIITVSGLDQVDRMDLYTLSGNLIGTEKNSKTMNVSSFNNGFYLLKMKSGDLLIIKQVIVKK